jgi:MFS family permease
VKELLRVLRNPNIAVLLSGRAVSSAGDYVYQIALSVAIFQYAHNNAFYVSLLWIARLVPGLALGPYLGGLSDRMGYKRAMIVADVGRMALVAGMAVVTQPRFWALIYPLALAVAVLGTLFNPASIGIIPDIVESPDEHMAANASMGEVVSIAAVVGSALGGVFAGKGLVGALLVADAVTFGLSAVSLMLVRTRPRAVAAEVTEGASGDDSAADGEDTSGFFGGFRLLAQRPLLVFAATVMALPELASGAVVVWIVPYSSEALHLGDAGVGYLYAALGLGAVAGGIVAALFGSNVRLDRLLAGGVATIGISLVLFGVVHVAVFALVCMAVLGLAETVEYAAFQTLLQQGVPEEVLGRAAGTMGSLFFNLMLIGNVASGVLAATLGLTVSIAALGVLTFVVAVWAWINLQRQTAGEPDAGTLAKVPAFQRVPLPVREWAVRRMKREEFPAGAVIIRQGEEGDKFYAIAKGTARVEVEGPGDTLVVDLGEGNFFGEIALLQNVPRTATVSAIEPLIVYSMRREDFEELQNRAGDLKNSLLETASARMEEDKRFRVSLSERLS